MRWEQLLSTNRAGKPVSPGSHHDRTQFQRDYDRVIFSSPFRRMQDKTQVFPLPGSIFVHNRLTHSLEVACVGRSLGNNASRFLRETNKVDTPLVEELGAVTAAACLAHDMGNPPFGHSGEKAISRFFKEGAGSRYREMIDDQSIWNDLVAFEGNANALRLLTHRFSGRREGGFALTLTSVAAMVKYPYPSATPGRPKFGYFQSEKETWFNIARQLGLKEEATTPGVFARHPLVYLVEAADDICYQIMDIEDAHKLGILPTGKTRELLMAFFDPADDRDQIKRVIEISNEVTDTNELIALLRSYVISKLVEKCSKVFRDNHDAILQGSFNGSLISKLEGVPAQAMKHCVETGLNIIYKHPSVVEIEIAGFKILNSLLEEFTHAVINQHEYYPSLLMPFIPQQYRVDNKAPLHQKLRAVVDFISGMTDVYALDLYRKINGLGL